MARPKKHKSREKIMILCLPASGNGGHFVEPSTANELMLEGSAYRVNGRTIQLKKRDDQPKVNDESCRMSERVIVAHARGKLWARALVAGWA